MKCVKCHKEIPPQSRFCLNCGAPQPELIPVQPAPRETSSADGGTEAPPTDLKDGGEFNWMAREVQLDPNLDYEAQRRYEGAAGKAIGCLAYGFFVIMGLLLLIPGVPFLAVFGLPLALLLGPLTYYNVGRLQEKLRSNGFLRKLPGFVGSSARVLALSVTGYLAVASLICILLMMATTRR